MIPESMPMTLDSILEGILDEEVASSPVQGGDSPASSISSSVASSPARNMLVSSSSQGLPCLAIKAELPDSCSMEAMVGKTTTFTGPKKKIKWQLCIKIWRRCITVYGC